VTVLDDIHRDLFAGVARHVSCFGDSPEFLDRGPEVIPVRKVVGKAIVLQPAVANLFAGGVGDKPMAQSPFVPLFLVEFIAENIHMGFVTITMRHDQMITVKLSTEQGKMSTIAV
jgi:hypothetical protein